MKVKYLFCILLVVLCCQASVAQKQTTISGYIKDKSTGEMLIGVNVYIKELMKGTTTNTYGFYSLTVDTGNYHLVVSYLGYFTQVIPLSKERQRLNFQLEPFRVEAKEVEITAEKADKNVQSTSMGTTQLSVEKIKKLPALLGEVDVLKIVQLLPGVQNAGEGTTGLYVRGGGPDQNLILLDEAQIYNAGHLFGFFSVFNADAIKNVTLIKGGMPANYGGKLASVLDISMKEGNNQNFKFTGGIGLISSRLTMEGPIKKGVSSFIVSARRTYIDILTAPFIKNSRLSGTGYYFYDLNMKANYTLSDKDRIFLSGYFGRDVLHFQNNASFKLNTPWGNSTATARWNHLFSDKLFMNLSAVYSDYKFSTEINQSNFNLQIASGIRDYNLKLDFNYFPNVRHELKYGVNYIFHVFTPSSITAQQGSTNFGDFGKKYIYANEYAAYVNDEYDLSEKVKVNAGLRYSAFQQIGPYDRYKQAGFGQEFTDTIHYKSGQNVQFYQAIEPRLSLRYAINMRSSLKAAYTYNNQYMHLVSFAAVTLPTDIWVPSSERVKPQQGNQYSVGYFRNFKDNAYETSVEVYYKDMKNQVEYADGVTPSDNINNNIENNLTFGKGTSYGTELFIKKNKGKLTGWIGYTLSYTNRIFPELNNGKVFYTRYDRRHDLSIVGTYELNEKWSFSSVFVFASGNAITIQANRYLIDGSFAQEYGDRNAFRMPPYHRLDISATYIVKKTEKFESSWNFSVYNVYNRLNPYFIYGEQTGTVQNKDLQIKAYQVSLFPIIPSIAWNFKF